MPHHPHVLFDVDGTLTDPFEGITRCIDHALAELGAPQPPRSELAWCIGPPLRRSFATLLGAGREGDVERAMTLYRERFADTGLYENTLYPGVPAALAGFREQGARLFVATSKPHVYAERILDHFGLATFFEAIHGAELDGSRSEKHEVIGWLMQQQRIDSRDCVMVGDRHHDIAGASANAIPAIGVLWGYGSEAELTSAGARALCSHPQGLVTCVARVAAG